MPVKFNWINWQQILLDDDRPSFHAKSIGLFLHTYMNNSNDIAFPSVATICGRMNITDKTVTKYTNELVELGYLIKNYRYGKSVEYIAIVPEFVDDSIVQGTKLPVSDEVRSSIGRDTITVSDDVRSNNQDNYQVNNQDYITYGNCESDDPPKPQRKNIPYQKIVEIYHDQLPNHPKVERLTQTRRNYLKRLWLDVDGDGLPDEQHWQNFFGYVKQSKFLTGRVQANGRKPFLPNLEWLTKPANYLKISEGMYHE